MAVNSVSRDTGPGLGQDIVLPIDAYYSVRSSDNDGVMEGKDEGKAEKGEGSNDAANAEAENEAPYCILPEATKVTIIIAASFSAIISPMSSSIYYPALNTLAEDLHVSISLITLTVTTYLIFQGLAPQFLATFSDIHGRRPAYLICFIIYLGANIGLALQNNYAALMVLRCLQACGSSGTIALSSAVVADLSTRDERGKYVGYTSMGSTLGTALGPVIGGLLDHFLGWRSIFWFLTILSGTLILLIVMTLPETCRTVVGNGSVPPGKWNRPLWIVIREGILHLKGTKREKPEGTKEPAKKRPSPLAAAHILREKEAGLILVYGALLFSGFIAVMSTLTSQLSSQFGFNAIQIGLCYLPMGVGSMTSRLTVGSLVDWNYRRQARLNNIPIIKNRQQDITNFNVEAVRLSITIPLAYAGSLCILTYGWVMQYRTSLAGPLVMVFFIGHIVSGSFSTLNTLIIDTHRESPATATASNNLLRCLMGAGASAIAVPLIDRIGIGWTGTFIAAVWVFFSPCLWAVYYWGHGWRAATNARNNTSVA